MRHTQRLSATLLMVAALSIAIPLAAQQHGGEAALVGALSGSVLDAETDAPIPGVEVIAESLGTGAPGSPRCGEPTSARGASTLTDRDGRYAFPDLAAGNYQVEMRHAGYRSARLQVEVCPATEFQISVAMQVEPVVLQPVHVIGVAEGWGSAQWNAGAGGALATRAWVEQRRQAEFLESDARVVTGSDVEQSLSLAEPDLFRALQRLPGVTLRDDYSAELWTRGAPWGQTSVLFDGVPLLNPLHAAGLFSAVNSDAVDRVTFHPGVQPLSAAAGGAGLVSIHSRRGAGDGQLRGTGDISLVSAGIAMDQEVAEGRGAWMVAGRRTYLDLLSGAFPYRFSDLVSRVDYELLPNLRVEASAIHEEDQLEGEIAGIVRPAVGSRGNTAARVTVQHPLLGGQLRHTVGTSRFDIAVDPLGTLPVPDPEAGLVRMEPRPYTLQPMRSDASYTFVEGAWNRTRLADAAGWRFGYRIISQSVGYRTEGGWPYHSSVATKDGHLSHAIAWGETTWRPDSTLSVEAGLNVGVNGGGSSSLALAPRLSARWKVTTGLTASAGLARNHQQLQPVQVEGPGLAPIAMAGTFWALAGGDVPLLRADIATAGAEYWASPEVLVSATSFRRWTSGMVVPDPRGGSLAERAEWVEGDGVASGFEFSARKLAGRWTGSLAYSSGDSRITTEYGRADAPWDRAHTLDLAAGASLTRGFRAGAAFTATSGAPYTRYWSVYSRCDASCDEWRLTPWVAAADDTRTPAYRNLAVQVDWEGSYGGWGIGAYLQVHNLLDRTNPAAYTGNELSEQPVCVAGPGGGSCEVIWASPRGASDTWLPGLRRIPSLGVRFRF